MSNNRFDRSGAQSGTLCVEGHDKWSALVVAQWLKSEERRLENSRLAQCKLQACALQSFRERLEAAAGLPPAQDLIDAEMN